MAVIEEAWIGGVSTRRVDDLVQAMGRPSSPRARCRSCARTSTSGCGVPRPADPRRLPSLWLDATYLKVARAARSSPSPPYIAMAVDTDGRREIIGLCVGPSEAETFWTDFLRSLKSRGLQGAKLVISDAHTASRPPSRGSSTRPGKDVAFTGSETRSPMCPRASIPSSLPRSGRPSTSPTKRPPSRPGATSQTSSAPLAEARRSDGRERGRRPRLHELPGPVVCPLKSGPP